MSTTKMTHHILHIASKDRETSRAVATNTNFWVNLSQPLQVKRIRLLSACIPNLIFNINSSNYVFKFNDGSDHTLNITAGCYSGTTLATQLQTQMRTVDSGYSVSYSETTFRMTISHSSTSFTIDFSGSDSPYEQLGFTQATTSSATSHTGTNVVNLASTKCIRIAIDEFPTSYVNTQTESLPHTFITTFESAEGTINFYTELQNYTQAYAFDARVSVRYLHVRLYDTAGDELSLEAGAEWEMTMAVDEED